MQVGDPFLEKLLLEACLEAMRSGAIEGIQDMGCLLYTSDAADERSSVDLGGRRIIKKKKNIDKQQKNIITNRPIIKNIQRK